MRSLRGANPNFKEYLNSSRTDKVFFQKNVEQLYYRAPVKEASYFVPKEITPPPEEKASEPKSEGPKETFSNYVIESEVGEDELASNEVEGEYYADEEDDAEGSHELLLTESSVPFSAQETSVEGDEKEDENETEKHTPDRLAVLCMKVIAGNFSTLWKCVKYLPQKNMKKLCSLIDLNTTDVGIAALAFHGKYLWERWAKTLWPEHHSPWAHGGSWKIYFLERYLSGYISTAIPNEHDPVYVRKLVKRLSPWIYTLDIKQLRTPSWPAAVDVESSTDTDGEGDPEKSVKSYGSLGKYLKRHIVYFPMPTSIERFDIQPILSALPHLTHLKLTYGFDNFSPVKDLKWSKITKMDAVNLSQALASCKNLMCFKFVRSPIDPQHFKLILTGLMQVKSLREAEFSYLSLTDKHILPVCGLLLMNREMKVLSLQNNNITSKGFIKLLHSMVVRDCQLQILDVSVNPIGDAGGVAMTSLLSRRKKNLKRLFMSGTELTHVSGYNFGVVLYFNKSLEVLDLSINKFNDFATKALLKGLQHNYTLQRIDVRQCGIPFESVRDMEVLCYNNMEKLRRKNYVYPKLEPLNFLTEFKKLEDLPQSEAKDSGSNTDVRDKEEAVMDELARIFLWATLKIKPKIRKHLMANIIEAVAANPGINFHAILDQLMLNKEKELIKHEHLLAENDYEERGQEGSELGASIEDTTKKLSEFARLQLLELDALRVLEDINRCGRVDTLLKSMHLSIKESLTKVNKLIESDLRIDSCVNMDFPFLAKFFPKVSMSSVVEGETEETEFEMEDLEEIDGESPDGIENVGELADIDITAAAPVIADRTESIQRAALKEKILEERTKLNMWPTLEPPSFPRNIPYRTYSDLELAARNEYKDKDFPYWGAQWYQKY